MRIRELFTEYNIFSYWADREIGIILDFWKNILLRNFICKFHQTIQELIKMANRETVSPARRSYLYFDI